MTRTPSAAAELARAIAALARPAGVDIAIAPSFPALDRVRAALLGSGIALAAQDVFHEREGAFTGEVSAAMLKDAGVSLVLVGHSERRLLRGERETDFARKMARLAEEGLAPLYCVGETQREREALICSFREALTEGKSIAASNSAGSPSLSAFRSEEAA